MPQAVRRVLASRWSSANRARTARSIRRWWTGECWGKKAEAAGECEAGQAVLFEGKLRKRQKTEGQWEMIVSGFEVTPVLTPAASLTGNPN